MHSSGVAYLLWLGCFLGLCGLHRFYLGKPVTGLLWLFTFGLLGVGQLLDLLLIPGMVAQANLYALASRNTNTQVTHVHVHVGGGEPNPFDFDHDGQPRRRRRR
jgi:TM2 domain-containing membrane protein YozV